MVGIERGCKAMAAVALAALLAGCASLDTAPEIATSPWARDVQPAAAAADAPRATPAWQHHTFPGKTPTGFRYVREAGRDAVAVRADRSASMLRQPVRVEAPDLGALRFSWKVPALIEAADMARRDADDAPVRIVLAFEGDRSRLSPRDAMLSELARTLTGEEMPYATLMYVWCNHRAPGEVIVNPRTDRIRKLVVESGAARLNEWLAYERDIRADYQRAFGEPPGALVGIALMSDTDNTRSRAQAWYGPVRLVAAAPRPQPLAR